MRRHIIIIVMALVTGAKALAQEPEWEWSGITTDSTYYEIFTPYELSDGTVLVTGRTGYLELWGGHYNYYTPTPTLMSFSSDGQELSRMQYPKDGYSTYVPFVLENSSGEAFLFITYSPDHDTCSPNYFKNFDPQTDHCILGLYKLNDDLSVAESHEMEIPIDTFEGNHYYMPVACGQLLPISAFVDTDGNIVGAYTKTVSYDPEEIRGYDSTVFFRMDFEGNIITRKSYCGNYHSGGVQKHHHRHIVRADSLYLYYGFAYDVTGNDQSNLAYLDHDFNLVRTRNYRHPNAVHPFSSDVFQFMNVVRSPHGTTYLTSAVSSKDDFWCHATLYEYDDAVNSNGGNYTPIIRYVERKTVGIDSPADWSCVEILSDNTLYYAYTLKWMDYLSDNWIVIEHLTPEFNTISTVFCGEDGDRKNYWAYGIKATEDDGVILVARSRKLNSGIETNDVRKYSANALDGIEEAHDNGLKVAVAYPNPGKDELNIRTGLKNAHVEIYDMSGKLVHSQAITGSVTSIEAETWPNGVYVWKVVSDGKEAESGKWVKE